MAGINAEKWVQKKMVTAREKMEDTGVYDLNLASVHKEMEEVRPTTVLTLTL